MMTRLKLFLLGPPQVIADDEEIEIRRRKALALLAYLALAGQPQRRDTLATLIWPDNTQRRARANLRRDLAALNDTPLAEQLLVERETVELPVDEQLWLDVAHFRRLDASAVDHDHPDDALCADCLAILAEAADLYRGDFLSGFSLRDSPDFDEWQSFQTESLRRELAAILERLVRGYSAAGDYEAAIPRVRRWLSLDPLHEPAHRHLMQLYVWTGQRAAALRHYHEMVALLEAELGLPPDEATTALYEQIRQSSERSPPLLAGRPDDRNGGPPPAPTPTLPSHNLPAQTAPFIGRRRELAALADLLADPEQRLITIMGAGGMGKTRLALEATQAQLERFSNGSYVVWLGALEGPDEIVPAIAKALQVSLYEQETSPETVSDSPPQLASGQDWSLEQHLFDFLAPKRMLLLLDNFEHLLAGADLVVEMLRAAPDLKILVTSRARLNVQGEQLFPLAGMDFPTEEGLGDTVPRLAPDGVGYIGQYSAVELFLQSARRVRPDFDPSAGQLRGVIQICRLVQGMPLAIVLAAGWVELLTPAEIESEIRHGLDFLASDLRDLPERQRSLRAVFDRSWQLLTESEQEIFCQASLFRGSFTREAAQVVAGASLRDLMALVNKSLFVRTPSGRYEVHELLRQYAAEYLDRLPATRDMAQARFRDYYADLLQRQEAGLKDSQRDEAIALIETELENVRLAWKWSLMQPDLACLGRAINGLGRFLVWSGRHPEGLTLVGELVDILQDAATPEAILTLLKSLKWQGILNRLLGRIEQANDLLAQSMALFSHPALVALDIRGEVADVLREAGLAASDAGQVSRAEALLEQSRDLYQAVGDRWGVAETLTNRAEVALSFGPYGSKQLLTIRMLGRSTLDPETLAAGERLMRQNLAVRKEMDDQLGMVKGLLTLGQALAWVGRFEQAQAIYREALTLSQSLSIPYITGLLMLNLGVLELDLGAYDRARGYGADCLVLFRAEDISWGIVHAQNLLAMTALAQGADDEARAALREATSIYSHMKQQNQVEVEIGFGLVALSVGDVAAGEQHLLAGWQTLTAEEISLEAGIALATFALLLAERGDLEPGLELYSLATNQPLLARSRWVAELIGRRIETLTAGLSTEVVEVARERGRSITTAAAMAMLEAHLGV